MVYLIEVSNTKETITISEDHIVPELHTPMRLQEYGAGIFMAVPTRSALKKAIKKAYVKVNGVKASTATIIRGGEHINLNIPETDDRHAQLELPLKVIYEDEYLAVVHKPAGIPVSGNKFKTIAHALPQNLEISTQPDATTPQPVHRLDHPTTGILLVGKTASCIRALNTMFAEKQIIKTYFAVTIGEMTPEGITTAAIDHQPARSDHKVMASVPSERFGHLNLVRLSPHTGRTHQLRKHMLSIGNPILGDQTYFHDNLILKGKGLYLHAWSLRFEHPMTGETLYLEDPLPQKYKKIFGDAALPDKETDTT
ncbi:RluA family pseudouridine synthase [Robertkochia sediminum]|uniref:RluA family pseudouridine synthase n=1 Tax=Robertkochia sediminum TaxID=2785326 RepID=UPI0019344B35|nr:RluA family pseudouridine synthase [Robertkochia sediminum]MBL7472565.1 RluA family pseudouridine synthase [Robertkochia sediminum]